VDDRGLISGRGLGFVSPYHRIQNDFGAHPVSCPMGTGGGGEVSFPAGKAAGLKVDHSPPCIAKVKNAWSYTSTPYVFMWLCLIK
jgi:hypothetical protein